MCLCGGGGENRMRGWDIKNAKGDGKKEREREKVKERFRGTDCRAQTVQQAKKSYVKT